MHASDVIRSSLEFGADPPHGSSRLALAKVMALAGRSLVAILHVATRPSPIGWVFCTNSAFSRPVTGRCNDEASLFATAAANARAAMPCGTHASRNDFHR